jgi:hypothetical protein
LAGLCRTSAKSSSYKTPAVPFLVVLPVFYSRCHGYAIFTQNIGAAGLVRCTPAISISFVTTMLRSQGKRTNISITLAGRAADPHRPHPCRQEPAISPVAVQPRNNHLTGVHLMGVYLMGVYLMGVYLTGVHLTGVHLMEIHFKSRHVSHVRVFFARRSRVTRIPISTPRMFRSF